MMVVITDLIIKDGMVVDGAKEVNNITFEDYDLNMSNEDYNDGIIDIFEDNYNKAVLYMQKNSEYSDNYYIRILMCDGKNLRIFNNENGESILKMYLNGSSDYFMHSSYCGCIIFTIRDGDKLHKVYATKVVSKDEDFIMFALKDSLDTLNSYGCNVSVIDDGVAIGKENCQITIDAKYFDGESSILIEIEHFL